MNFHLNLLPNHFSLGFQKYETAPKLGRLFFIILDVQIRQKAGLLAQENNGFQTPE